MATKNAINNKSQELTVDPGASGDSFVQFDINATGEFRIGVDDDASDSFKISQGSALGTNDTFVMTTNGERTLPLQPSFSAEIDGFPANVTGDATVYSLVWSAEIFDRGGNFASNTFTAPVTGIYKFSLSVGPTNLSSSWTSAYIQIVATGDTYRSCVYNIGVSLYVNATVMQLDALIPMTATDTATAQIMVGGSAKTVDIQGNDGAGAQLNLFSGVLIC